MTPTSATTSGAFSYEGTAYVIDLCDKHAEMFDRDLLAWVRLAHEEEPRAAIQPAKLPPRPSPTPSRPVFTSPSEPEPEPVKRKPELSDFALSFGFTDHAEERMQERGITRHQVFEVIDDYGKVRRAGSTPGTHLYHSDGIAVVVNEEERSVITVAHQPVHEKEYAHG